MYKQVTKNNQPGKFYNYRNTIHMQGYWQTWSKQLIW